MVAEIGLFTLVLAFMLALAQAVLPLVGAARGDVALMAAGRVAAVLQALMVSMAFAALMVCFARLDLSVALVADHAHSTQPLGYRIAATWGNHEGSMLLWVLILALFGAAVALFGNNLRRTLQARVLGVQGLIGAAFLAFSLFTSSPFRRLNPAPRDGAELNPLLQDPGLIFHPPLLYLGYVGFSVAFAFAMAALIEGRVDAAWARWVRPWVLAAWVCLTLGIALGSFWAYYELGWGGWWFWDPVENASLMPWLLGTALLHSALVLERRGALVSWTILLAILTFSFSLLGTFLVRSGILTSVHAFAVDATRGVYILILIAASTGVALALFAWRAPAMRSGALFGAVSREASLTINNLLLMVATVTVALGTFYPVIIETLSEEKISVGPPFYNLTFAPIFALLLVLVPFGPVLNWRQDRLRTLWRRVRLPAAAALLVLIAALLVAGYKLVLTSLGLALAAWLILGALMILAHRWRIGKAAKTPWWQAARTTPLAVYGMVLAHAGLGVSVAGVTAMASWETSRILMMQTGQSIDFAGAAITLIEVREVQGPNYIAEEGVFHLKRGRRIDDLVAERRFFPVRQSQTTEAAIRSSIAGNDYLVIGEPQPGGRVVRLYRHPLVGWIWFGALLMAAGGVASLADRRFRLGLRRGTDMPAPAPMEAVTT
ncbi:MAG TPA: heme lyase CcmF/NrfE family subunit [Sphingobium sp.]|nr:heme lyase CcmF/NrfE family subunit [Sphingobium sp.]